jgi:hypothetical protein
MTDEEIIQLGISRGFDPEFCRVERMRWVKENEPERFARMQKPIAEQKIEEVKDQIRVCHSCILSYKETISTSQVKGEVYFCQKELELELIKIKKLQKRISWLQKPVKKDSKEEITQQDIERARLHSPLDIIGEPVRRFQDEWVYLSPLRKENRPSFHFNIKKGMWIDRGTGEGGDMIDLVMRLDGSDFITTVKKLM